MPLVRLAPAIAPALTALPYADASDGALRLVAIGGGTGLPVVLSGLSAATPDRTHSSPGPAPHLTAIVTVTDDGGSSGRLRRDLGILPPGDIRNCLAAMAGLPSPVSQLMHHRFSGSHGLSGHAIGNLLIAAMTEITGDFATAVDALSGMFNVRGRILPSTREDVALRAEFDSGEQCEGETAIVSRAGRIKRLSLHRRVRPVPEAIKALVNADAIVVGPGSLYTSVLPNLLVDGIAATMHGVNAVRIYVANLMTEPGETDDMSLDDHLRVIREHVGVSLFDYVLVNRSPLQPPSLLDYAHRGARPVARQSGRLSADGVPVVERELAWNFDGGKIRHEPGQLARAILDLVAQGRPRPQTAGSSRLC